MPKVQTPEKTVVSVRFETELVEAVEQLAKGNNEDRAEMVRRLVRRGIRAVVDESQQRASVAAPNMSREGYEQRVEAFMEALSDLLAKMAEHDLEGAAELSSRAANSLLAYSADLGGRLHARETRRGPGPKSRRTR